jgi:DNA-binding MarR family transcriptional regulator
MEAPKDSPDDAPDELIHQSLRLRIMATLNALPAGERIAFTRLRAVLSVTDGNLGAHLATLESADYVTIKKDFVARKPRTRIAITRRGRSAFARHVNYLRGLLDDPPTTKAAE